MKYCPKCNETYQDEYLNFCLNDGELLNEMGGDNAPPTVMFNQTRVTNEKNWSDQNTNFSDFNHPNQQIYQQPFTNPSPMPLAFEQNKTLPTVSLVLGIVSLFCCYGGVFTGLIAMVLGFMGMKNANNNPEIYGGKQMAIIGMILGGLSFILAVIFIFLGILGQIFN